jgi:DNA gyrase/topoisomerase IV subunit B
MSIKLTNFGMQNLAMRLVGKESLPPDQVSMLIQTIRDCLRFCDVNLPRYGIRALDFLKLREERGAFPSYMVETRENGVLSTSYAWSKAEAEQQVAAANERKNAAIAMETPVTENAEDEGTDDESVATDDVAKEAAAQYDEDGNLISNAEPQAIRVADDNHWTYLPEAVALEGLAQRLADNGLAISQLYENDAPVVELVDTKNDTVMPVNTLNALCEAITDRGRRGLTIQRYKGLGEMSSQELWETTMNPETRWMIQVTVEDAAAADETFSMLMGDDVVVRRNFIEENADRILNPDI